MQLGFGVFSESIETQLASLRSVMQQGIEDVPSLELKQRNSTSWQFGEAFRLHDSLQTNHRVQRTC